MEPAVTVVLTAEDAERQFSAAIEKNGWGRHHVEANAAKFYRFELPDGSPGNDAAARARKLGQLPLGGRAKR
jgi:hypothetical protein